MASTDADQREAAAQKDETPDKNAANVDADAADGEGHDGEGQDGEGYKDDRTRELAEQARGIFDRYDGRDTVVLPDSDGTISGTAVNDFLDDNGEPVDHSDDPEPTEDEREKNGPFG